MKHFALALLLAMVCGSTHLNAEEDYGQALKRAQYLLNATTPTDTPTFSGLDSIKTFETKPSIE